jgi:hypothetical protein
MLLTFNGSRALSASSRDKDRDMTVSWDPTTDDVYLANLHLPPDVLAEYRSCMSAIAGAVEPEPPPRPLAPVAQPEIVDPEALADKLIEKVGFEEAIRLIQARKLKRKRGRPDYEVLDHLLFMVAVAIRRAWKVCGRPLPTRHALATKVVHLCWDDWDAVEHLLGIKRLEQKCLRDSGVSSKETVVKRLLGRPFWVDDRPSWVGVDDDEEALKRDWGPKVIEALEASDRETTEELAKRTADVLNALHRQRPDLRLLPGKSFRKIRS